MTKQQKEIERIKTQMMSLGPMLAGSLSQQWNVCGKEGCRCKDAKNPLRHGPYYQLGFRTKGRSSTMFVRKDDVPEVQKRIACYRKFRDLSRRLAEAYIHQVRQEGFVGTSLGSQR